MGAIAAACAAIKKLSVYTQAIGFIATLTALPAGFSNANLVLIGIAASGPPEAGAGQGLGALGVALLGVNAALHLLVHFKWIPGAAAPAAPAVASSEAKAPAAPAAASSSEAKV